MHARHDGEEEVARRYWIEGRHSKGLFHFQYFSMTWIILVRPTELALCTVGLSLGQMPVSSIQHTKL